MSKINYLLPISLLFSATGSLATENQTIEEQATYNQWYAGARLGGTHYHVLSSEMLGGSGRDPYDFGGGLFLGYNFASWLALETGYTYLGKAKFSDNASIKQQGFDLVGKFTWHATESVGLYAKAGGFYYLTDGKGALSSYDDKGIAGTTGLGIEYMLTENLLTRLEYQYYSDLELNDSEMNATWDTHFYGLSLVYSWGDEKPAAAVMPEPVVGAEPEPVVVEPEPEIVPLPVVQPEPVKIVLNPITVELPFAFDSIDIGQEYLDQLAPIADHLINFPEAKLFVVGHTDSRGSEAYNQKLSEERAALIGKYLAEKFSIDEIRIIKEGRGELDPRADNATEEGRSLNRRVSVFTPSLEVEEK